MVQKAASVLKYAISLAVAIGLLFLVFNNVDFEDFWARAQRVNYSWVLFSIGLSVAGYAARAYRWNILVTPLGYEGLTTFKTTLAVLVGYMANLAFPRLGEVTRCALMKRNDGVPLSVSIGTVITERAFDLISLLILIFISFTLEADVLISFIDKLFTTYVNPEDIYKLVIAAVAAILLFVVAAVIIIKKAGDRLKEFIRQLIAGLVSIRKIKNKRGFIVSTIVLWTVYYFMSYLIVFSLPDTSHLSWVVGIMLLVTGGIALAIPVQGGFGTYHTLISVMLAFYGIDHVTGVFLATLLHTSQVVAMAFFGAAALLVTVFIKKKSDSKHQNQNA